MASCVISETTETRLKSRAPPWFLPAAVASALVYSFFTGHIWEDYFITFRHSQNLVDGYGLVYHHGERVHGFTSPLGVLLPAFCYWITGQKSYMDAVWLFRLFSIAAYAAGGWFILKAIARSPAATRMAAGCFGLLYILEPKGVAFSCNGMETGFMLLFLGWALLLLQRDGLDAWLQRGLCWAGLMWTRPDGCIYVMVLSLVEFVFGPNGRKQVAESLARSAALCAVVYAPWFIFAWSYYGSPVPQTLLAKSTLHWRHSLPEHIILVGKTLFSPINYTIGGWPQWLGYWSCGLSAFSSLYWLIPSADRLGRKASLCFAGLAAYLVLTPTPSAWYLPPVTTCGFLVISCALGRLVRADSDNGVLAVAFVLVLESAFTMAMNTWAMRIQQQIIEDGNRMQIGLWLHKNALSTDRVYLEPLGYIGYFSKLRMMDFPGLVCPRNSQLIREGKTFLNIPEVTKPEWVVLRGYEVLEMKMQPYFVKQYELAQTFDVLKELNAYQSVAGLRYITMDSIYVVYKKRAGQ